MKKLFFASIFALFVFTGCQNDDEEQTVDLTTDESKELVDNSGASLSTDIVSLVESDGVRELVHLVNLLNEFDVISGRTSQQTWTKERLKTIIQYFVDGTSARVGNSNPTTFDDIKGLYEWNSELQDFDVEASEFFIVKFPTEDSETNNAEFKISNLTFESITETDSGFASEYSLPSMIDAHLKVNEIIIVELTYSVNWSSTGKPEEAAVNLFIKPFNFTINFVDTFTKSTSLLASVSIDEEIIMGIDVDVAYETDNKDDPYMIEGFVQYRDLKIDGDVDVREIGEEANPNDFVDLALYSEDAKIGDIVFILEEDSDGFADYVPYVEYSDGTKQDLEEVLAPVLKEIENIFAEFE